MDVAGSIPGSANFLLRFDDSHYDRIHSSLDNGYVGEQPVAWKE